MLLVCMRIALRYWIAKKTLWFDDGELSLYRMESGQSNANDLSINQSEIDLSKKAESLNQSDDPIEFERKLAQDYELSSMRYS